MKDGFYIYKYNVYYGCYDENQVSGCRMIDVENTSKIKTDHAVPNGASAVVFWENHKLLNEEYEGLNSMLLKLGSIADLNLKEDVSFFSLEQRLGIAFPKELKLIYKAIHNKTKYFDAKEHFLPLEEIYIDDGILVFFKKIRTPIAGYDLKGGCLAEYRKKKWEIDRSGFCCYQFCMARIITIAMENKPFVRTGRCKGEFVTTLNIEKELEMFCNEKYHILSEFDSYTIAVMYSESGLIAWIRSNGFYGDIHAGADNESELDELSEHLKNITWK